MIRMRDPNTLAAGMFCVGFDGLTPSRQVLDLIERGVSGVVLFARNVESPHQVAALVRELKQAAGRPLLACVDQEGGRVMRLRDGFTPVPTMRAIGSTRQPELAGRVGRLLAREVRAVGFDLDFAPVLDVDTNPDNPVIGNRSFGRSPELVARMGAALIEGMQGEGVAACGKHFPGHGDTAQDSHLDLPRLPHGMERLESIELPPFREAIRAGIGSLMTAHVIFEALDPSVPATISRRVLTGLLRERLGFEGLIVSDDLEMKAVADHYGIDATVVAGTAAGVDLFLGCHANDQVHQAIDRLVEAVRAGEVDAARLEAAEARRETLFQRFVRPAPPTPELDALRCQEHLDLVRQIEAMTDGSVTVEEPDPTEVLGR